MLLKDTEDCNLTVCREERDRILYSSPPLLLLYCAV